MRVKKTIKIQEITKLNQFHKLRRDWNSVLRRSRDDSIVLTWEQMAAAAKYLAKKQTIRILYATNKKKIIGIAPFRQSKHTFRGHFNYTVLESLASGYADYSGLILAENETECLHLFLKYLFQKDDWDYLWIHDVPETSIIFNILSRNSALFPKFEICEGQICPYIAIPDSMHALLKSLSPKFRKNLRLSMKNLRKDHGKVEFKEYHEIYSLEQAMHVFFDLHQKRWETKGSPGAFWNKREREIYLNAAKIFAERNWIRLYFLMVKDKPIAANYCYNYKGKMYSKLGGWDPEYSAYGPGNLLIMKTIEKCIEEKIREYDFMQGAESYKFRWSNRYRRNLHLKFVNNHLASQITRFGIEASKKMQVDGFLGKILSI